MNELPDDLYDFFRHMLEKVDPSVFESFISNLGVRALHSPSMTVMQIAIVLCSNLNEAIKGDDFTSE